MATPKWLYDVLLRLSGNDRAQRLLQSVMNLSSDLQGMGPGGFQVSSSEAKLVDKLLQQYERTSAPLRIFDVGAHHGEFLDSVAQPLLDNGIPFHVEAFEPSSESFEQLRLHHGMRANIRLNNFALGRAYGEVDLYAEAPGSALASFSRRRLDHFGLKFDHTERVAVQTLDEYCLKHSIESIDLLKLDVEGHELDVLQGGLRLFADRRIRLLTFEFGGCNIDSRTFFQDYWYLIKENRIGEIFRFTPSGYLAPVTEYNELCEQFCPTNYLVECYTS